MGGWRIVRCPGSQKCLLQARKTARWRRENKREGGSKLWEWLWFTSLHTSTTSTGSFISSSPTSCLGQHPSLVPILHPIRPEVSKKPGRSSPQGTLQVTGKGLSLSRSHPSFCGEWQISWKNEMNTEVSEEGERREVENIEAPVEFPRQVRTTSVCKN